MPKLPVLSGHEIIKILKGFGFEFVRQRGSHAVLRHGSVVCVVPIHPIVKTGTLRSILRQAQIDVQDFIDANSHQ
ncbi:MAG: addiction module toxin, HicA family [Actinobacteria bacterium]|nr:addiction module toxin, HicA family [Actinomycetota bacterium]